jgi:hypothetical protein
MPSLPLATATFGRQKLSYSQLDLLDRFISGFAIVSCGCQKLSYSQLDLLDKFISGYVIAPWLLLDDAKLASFCPAKNGTRAYINRHPTASVKHSYLKASNNLSRNTSLLSDHFEDAYI